MPKPLITFLSNKLKLAASVVLNGSEGVKKIFVPFIFPNTVAEVDVSGTVTTNGEPKDHGVKSDQY